VTVAPQEGNATILKRMMRGVVEMMPEILRWRRHAEVIGGPELRARITEEVEALAALDLPERAEIP
jgi:hypothetical protein